jgi:hypothetical protein
MGFSPSRLPVALGEVLEHLSNANGPGSWRQGGFLPEKKTIRRWGVL